MTNVPHDSSTTRQPDRETPTAASAERTAPSRLMSLDALRGFDMFWIVGGEGFAIAIAAAINPKYGQYVEHLLTHPEWNGYTPYDQIFPLFMFIAGVAIPFALLPRVERGESKTKLALRIIRRGLMLVFLGAVFNGLLAFDFANQRYPSVLGRIGLGYMFAALIAINTRPRGQIAWIVALLVGYWAAMKFIPVPGYGPGDWAPGHTLADYLDRLLLPGTLYETVRDPEGLLSTIPSIATVLSGVLAGHWLRADWPSGGGLEKTAGLAIAGLCSVALGWLCDGWFPINKNLWTSSFVLWTSGWSALALSLFYLVIDVWKFRRWAFVFVVIGMNAITLYLVREFVDFPAVFKFVFGRAIVAGKLHATLIAGGEIFLVWLFGYALYRAKIFIRV